MITYLVSDLNRNPLSKLIRRSGKQLPRMRIITYDAAFRRLSVPRGTLVFTDFDLLTDYELDAAGSIAAAAATAGPDVRILNHPLRATERAAMHRRLNAAGLNPVVVTRIEDEMPRRYPVFIRLQAGCEAPDTGLIANEAEYRRALAALDAAGRPRRGRIAVSYEAAPDADGNFRKYGAFRIGDRIVPQHILRAPGWYVKKSNTAMTPAFAQEELAFVRDNPHRDALMALFDKAGYEFGRADYTLVDGKLVLFEINSNPSFPDLRQGVRQGSARHLLLAETLHKAFRAIDIPASSGRVRFGLNVAIGHNISRRRWWTVTRQLWKLRLATKRDRDRVWPPAGGQPAP